MLSIINLQKFYGAKKVLDIGELSLQPGRIHALIGPNGSGKSTLLRILAGTLTADSGEIHYTSPPAQQAVAYMPQKTHSFRFSVLKNVMMALHGLPKQEAARLSLAALNEVGLAHLAAQRADTLSGGEAQRMAFARMIALPRRLLLLDEPTSATDILGNDLVEEVLLRFVKKHGCTVLFSTHSPAQALKLGDIAVALHNGQLAESGPARQVLTAPQNPEVINFLKHWLLI